MPLMSTRKSYVDLMEQRDNFLMNSFDAGMTEESAEYLAIDDVRVYPASIIFNDAYDGKKFKASIEIINSGRNVAFVRILNPNAKVNIS